jgi:hypothetical protein
MKEVLKKSRKGEACKWFKQGSKVQAKQVHAKEVRANQVVRANQMPERQVALKKECKQGKRRKKIMLISARMASGASKGRCNKAATKAGGEQSRWCRERH